MGRKTIFREIEMDNLNSDLDLLENLSKKISDLIYNNEPLYNSNRKYQWSS